MPGLIHPGSIRTDIGTQMRSEVSIGIINDDADAMERGIVFPPIRVCYDEPRNQFIMIDGFHRLAAHMKVRPNDQICAEQVAGDISTAIWESIGTNKAHGLRRTNEDKRRAVVQALKHPKGAELSDQRVADYVGVSRTLVSQLRTELECLGELVPVVERIGRDGKNIRQHRVPPP